jgi:hypothetical protein
VSIRRCILRVNVIIVLINVRQLMSHVQLQSHQTINVQLHLQ